MKRLFNSCFGLGWLPIAPGTWGSLPAVAVFVIMNLADAGVAATSIVMIAVALTASVFCIKFASASIQATGKSDPSEVVLDELAGQAVVFIAVYIAEPRQLWLIAAGGFLLFRFFDIFKPWPIRQLEKLPAGVGILADDLAAGLFAAISLYLGIWFFG